MKENEIVIVGVGGLGTYSIMCLEKHQVNADLIAVCDHEKHLNSASTAEKILLGKNPRLNLKNIVSKIKNAKLVILLNGIGGNVGTNVAPQIAKSAKKNGAKVILIATMPFTSEKKRHEIADGFISSMKKITDEIVMRYNDSLIFIMPENNLEKAFEKMEEDLAKRLCLFIKKYSKNSRTSAKPFFKGPMYRKPKLRRVGSVC